MDQLKEVLERYKNPEVLDVATGGGKFLEVLFQAVNAPKRLIGIDQKQTSIEAARSKFAERQNFGFERMDVHQLHFEDESFDIVSISNSLHHLRSAEEGLNEMVRVLRPGGALVIYEMVSDGLTDKQQTHMLLHHYWAEIDRRSGIDHNPTYTRDEIRTLLASQNSLSLIKSSEINEPAEESGELIESLKESVSIYVEKSKGWDDEAFYRDMGSELLARIENVGLALATECLMVYCKDLS